MYIARNKGGDINVFTYRPNKIWGSWTSGDFPPVLKCLPWAWVREMGIDLEEIYNKPVKININFEVIKEE